MLIERIMAVLPDYVFWKDKKLTYLGCNDNAAKLLGLLNRKDIVGKTDFDLYGDSNFIEQTHRYDLQVLKTETEKADLGEVLVLKNGKVADVISERKIFYDDQNNIAGILVIYVESEKRNLADQTFFEHMLESVPYYIFWKNKDSYYLGGNTNFAKLVGTTPKDLIGKTDFDLGWGKGEAEFFRQADQKVMREKDQVNLEEVLKRPDGSEIVMLVSKVPVRNQEGDTLGMLGISVDITELKNTERELKIAKEKAELANQAKSDFIASMSHDLRTPLNAIIGAADVLKLKKHYNEQTPFIESVSRASKHLLGLIEDVLGFSKLEAGKLELHSQPFDLLQLIEEVIEMISQQAHQKHLKLITSYAESTPRYFFSDPNAIRRILVNLIGNAIKFTNEGHVIISVEDIAQSKTEAILQIMIEDTGIGIPKDQLEVIFDRFTRVRKFN